MISYKPPGVYTGRDEGASLAGPSESETTGYQITRSESHFSLHYRGTYTCFMSMKQVLCMDNTKTFQSPVFRAQRTYFLRRKSFRYHFSHYGHD